MGLAVFHGIGIMDRRASEFRAAAVAPSATVAEVPLPLVHKRCRIRRLALSCFVRVRHPSGEELTIDLIELEDALQGVPPGDYYLLPKSGRIVLISSEEMDDEGGEAVVPDDEEALPI